MRLLLVDNVHLFKDRHGNYYSKSIYNDAFLNRYLNVFTSLHIISKVRLINDIDETYNLINTNRVTVVELPFYKGLLGLICNVAKLIKILYHLNKDFDMTIYRMAQIEGILTYMLSYKKRPFALEIVNDPKSFTDVNFILRLLAVKTLKRMLRKTIGVSYVTKNYLQKRYPVKNTNAVCESYSSVDIDNTNHYNWEYRDKMDSFKLIHVSNQIETNSKGHKTSIDIIQKLRASGYKVTLDFYGDGSKVEHLKLYIERKQLSEYIKFKGKLKSSDEVLKVMALYDLFIFPSQYEGLPRVIIEAQSIGLPCVASNVGGISELLSNDYLADPSDIDRFVGIISNLINNPELLINQSTLNRIKSLEFSKDKLTIRRNKFYKSISEIVAKGEVRK